MEIRTDLALERAGELQDEGGLPKGVSVRQESRYGTRATVVTVTSRAGETALGKPRGTYITVELGQVLRREKGSFESAAQCISDYLKDMLKLSSRLPVLVAGLGNREVTPDALGPEVAGNLCITRHIINEYGEAAFDGEQVNRISAIVPGVMAQTGMETLEIIRGIVEQTHPTALVVVDALAARNTKRLNRTIQISDAGIHPGSGVGNHRQALTKETLGVPVIAIGVPTVVDAATIAADTMETLVEAMSQAESLKNLGYTLSQLDSAEKYQLIRELISPQLNGMFVTPKDIDETVKRISFTISEGINLALKAG